jgi:exopolysaccharide biosynthesis protein
LLLAACSARAPQPAPPRADTTRVERVAPGVVHEYRWYAAGPWAVHTVVIDPRTCGVEFRTVKGNDHVVGRETTSAMAKRTADRFDGSLLAAINADFFSFDPPGVSEGPQISNGTLIKSEGTHREAIEDRLVRLRPVFAFTADRKSFLTHTRLRGSVRAQAFTVPLGGVNVRSRTEDAFVFDSFFGDATPADTGALELMLREIRAPPATAERRGVLMAIDTSVEGVAIPHDGFVVSARGSARAALTRLAVGDSIGWTAAFDSLPGNITEMIGGYPMLLVDGQDVHNQETGLRSPFAERRHPRAAIGLDAVGLIHIVAVDGRQAGYSEGMSLPELSQYLRAHGITNAMNLDGGGSTTLVVADQVVNRVSDSAGERAVANALVILGNTEACN